MNSNQSHPYSCEKLCTGLNTQVEKEYSKYLAVIHLDSPGVNRGYNNRNPFRLESAAEALILDQQIHEVWKNHVHYYRVGSTGNFNEKVNQASKRIYQFLPQCCQDNMIERSK